MRVCLMIEGQEDVTWEQWRALASAAEENGFEALFRSDHYGSVVGRADRGSLDAWQTLAALAAVTSRIRLGTLVSPATFRHPSVLARAAVTVDHISGGRVELGLGAGWNEREHSAHGFPFPPTRDRMDMLAEQLEIVHCQWAAEPFSFDGRFYRMTDSDPRPKPVQSPHPPLIMGGGAGPRSAGLAARWADEYNVVAATPDECRERGARVAAACEQAGREPIPLSLMTAVIVGDDRAEVDRRTRAVADWMGGPPEPPPGSIAGTPDEVVERLRELEAAGVERIMVQHLLHGDLDAIELIGREVIPAVA